MTTITRLFFSLPFLVGVAGCGSSDAPPAATADAHLAPTFTNVFKEVITPKYCSGPFCHSGTLAGFELGSESTLYSELVNHPASGPKCRAASDAGNGLIRVVPGHPDQSLLYLKLNHTPPCGDAMPSSGAQLTSEQIALVHDWIAAGAKDD